MYTHSSICKYSCWICKGTFLKRCTSCSLVDCWLMQLLLGLRVRGVHSSYAYHLKSYTTMCLISLVHNNSRNVVMKAKFSLEVMGSLCVSEIYSAASPLTDYVSVFIIWSEILIEKTWLRHEITTSFFHYQSKWQGKVSSYSEEVKIQLSSSCWPIIQFWVFFSFTVLIVPLCPD